MTKHKVFVLTINEDTTYLYLFHPVNGMHEAYALQKNILVHLPDPQVSRQRDGTVWIRCINPTEEEIIWLSKITGAPEAEFRETMEEEERPKLETGKYMEIIYSSPHQKGDEIATVPLYFYVNRNILLTIEKREILTLRNLVKLVRHNKGKFLFKRSLGHFIFA